MPFSVDLVSMILGLTVGGLLGFLSTRIIYGKKLSGTELTEAVTRLEVSEAHSADLKSENSTLKQDLEGFHKDAAALQERENMLRQQIHEQKDHMDKAQEAQKLQFENLANKIFEHVDMLWMRYTH